jgi:carboxymethylenebutenolidase
MVCNPPLSTANLLSKEAYSMSSNPSQQPEPSMDRYERYLVEEFYDDYREGSISRRTFIRRVAFITGSMAATISVMSLVGCTADELPTPTEAMPLPETAVPATAAAAAGATATTPSATPTGPRSPFSVAADDPAVQGSAVTFPSGGDEIGGYLARPAAEGVYPAILISHENRGLTPHIEDVARRFAKAGYVALAVDLLAREGGTASRDRDEVPGLLTGAGPERHVADFAAGLAYLQGLDSVDDARIGMTGYCFGGGMAWRAATALPELKAVVPFYGPAPELADVPKIGAAVLGVYGELDERVNAGIPDLEAALKAAGITHQMNIYPGANHAFHNDTSERYDEAQATQAWNDTLAWFAQYL